ncbi:MULTISPECIES: hypothetical protein [unclassified Streptomyces]|uniref:hypothetical protein n=1 Tax=unclassified Streptomyces TaxID=2593676 RepID=UPI0007F55689|nr:MULTISPECIES: hypothetical protein [unclassified Streptomyces]AZM64992.1 hypothetical protein DLM49_36440 [Streptomyces sp. WAC 01438]RSM85852.1 hypothetical protein DMA10_36880 [Streptomyces sp. WAC 01420]SBT93982.1 hypothetical protein GA0115233_107616 [Streptomyces sp. DI166]
MTGTETAKARAAIALGIDKLRELALGDTADHQDQADVLKALYDDTDRDNSVLVQLSDLLSDLGVTLSDQGAEDAADDLGEAAAYIGDNAGLRLHRAHASLTSSQEG